MTRPHCSAPIGVSALAEYWLGELDELGEARVEQHLLGCDHCSQTLQGLVDLGAGIRALARRGALPVVVSEQFVAGLAARGVRLREYRVARNGSVYCTVAPEDDVVISRLEAPLGDVEQLDLRLFDGEGNDRGQLHDIPFDRAARHVLLMQDMERLRKLPKATVRNQLVAVERGQQRVIGDYTFHHTPWPSGN